MHHVVNEEVRDGNTESLTATAVCQVSHLITEGYRIHKA